MDPSRNSFEKLAGTSNYQVWSIKMKSYLIAQDLWDVIEISSTKSLAMNLESKISKVISFIILSCEDHIIRLLDPNDLAANAWKKLAKQYGHVGFSARHLSFQSLVSTHISSCQSVDQFIDQFRSHVNTLSQMSESDLPQWLLLSIFINNVSSKYEAWSQSVMQQVRLKSIPEDSRVYLEEIIASLIDEARRIDTSGSNSIGNSSNHTSALNVRKSGKPKLICQHCGKIHKSENCWQMFPEKRPKANLSNNSENLEHNPSLFSSRTVAFLLPEACNNTNTWILDSGATQHTCNNKQLIYDFQPCESSITIANSTKMDATERGNVSLTTRNGTSFTLLNVLYVPKLASNLISVCCATRNRDMRFNFVNGECQIMFKDSLLATAKQQDSLLVLQTITTNKPYAYTTKGTDSITWHRRLGHINKDYMTKGSLLSQIGPIQPFTCSSCLKNKSTRVISRNPPTC